MLDDKVVNDAISSGTMWRGIEVILHGRGPRDAWAGYGSQLPGAVIGRSFKPS